MNKTEFKINTMCQTLKVSRSGYYRWLDQRTEAKDPIREDIKRVFFESHRSYGSPRIYRQLKTEGITCGRHRIARLMREDGIIARRHRKYKKPVSMQRIQPVANNILDRAFQVSMKDTVWACDVSYFWTHDGWVHLAIVMDLFSRKVIGWSMSNRIDKELTQDALSMALAAREPNRTVMHHSDQGAEYSNKEYQALLRKNNMVISMSRKANCYDNAVVESFFKTIKTELTRRKKFNTKDEAQSAIFEYIEIFYNRKRMHSTLGYLSPAEYERLNSIN
ncbi:MAG TPA: IS3 family transposase [Candidatus Omnitrophota bacterium]|nr:IS3 family transposase [Candidatus Omnitrophota bacterium]